MRKYFVFFLAFILFVSVSHFSILELGASSKGKVTYKTISVTYAPLNYVFDDVVYVPPEGEEGFLYNDRTYLPLRFVSYTLGKDVDWDGNTYSVIVTEPDEDALQDIEAYKETHRMTIEKMFEAEDRRRFNKDIRVAEVDLTYLFFGEEKFLDVEDGMTAFIIEGRTFVPLRFMAESLGQTIDYDSKTYTITTISTSDGDESEEGADEQDSQGAGTPHEGGIPGAPIQPTQPPVVDEAYESIITDAERAISRLRLVCENRFVSLYSQYMNATSQDVKDRLIDAGFETLEQCDAQFEDLMVELEDQLVAGQYDSSVVAAYRQQYEEEKSAAIALLLR